MEAALFSSPLSRPGSRDSVVGIRTGLRAVRSGVRNRACATEVFFVFNFFRQTPGPIRGPPDLLFHGCLGSFPAVKLPDRDFDHSLPFCAEVKNEWRYISALLIRLHGLQRANFTSNLFQDRLWDRPRLLPSGYNDPRVLYPWIKRLATAVNLMQKLNEEWANTCIPIYVISGAVST